MIVRSWKLSSMIDADARRDISNSCWPFYVRCVFRVKPFLLVSPPTMQAVYIIFLQQDVVSMATLHNTCGASACPWTPSSTSTPFACSRLASASFVLFPAHHLSNQCVFSWTIRFWLYSTFVLFCDGEQLVCRWLCDSFTLPLSW